MRDGDRRDTDTLATDASLDAAGVYIDVAVADSKGSALPLAQSGGLVSSSGPCGTPQQGLHERVCPCPMPLAGAGQVHAEAEGNKSEPSAHHKFDCLEGLSKASPAKRTEGSERTSSEQTVKPEAKRQRTLQRTGGDEQAAASR